MLFKCIYQLVYLGYFQFGAIIKISTMYLSFGRYLLRSETARVSVFPCSTLIESTLQFSKTVIVTMYFHTNSKEFHLLYIFTSSWYDQFFFYCPPLYLTTKGTLCCFALYLDMLTLVTDECSICHDPSL